MDVETIGAIDDFALQCAAEAREHGFRGPWPDDGALMPGHVAALRERFGDGDAVLTLFEVCFRTAMERGA